MTLHARIWLGLAAGMAVAAAGLVGASPAGAAETVRPGNPCGLVSGPQLTRILGHGRPHASASHDGCTWVFPDRVTFQEVYLAEGTPVPSSGGRGVAVTQEPGFSPGAFVEVVPGATYFAYRRAGGGWIELTYRAQSSAKMLAVARIVHRHAP